MLVNLDAAARLRQFRRSWPVIAAASVGLAAELVALLLKGQLPAAAPSHDVLSGNTEALGAVLLSKYLVAFELASIVLLVAIVGSVWMGQPRGNQDIERSQA